MQRSGVLYTIGFAALICVVCSIMVAASAVSLKNKQTENRLLYRQKNVLIACGLIEPKQSVPASEIQRLFKQNIRPRVINLKTGEYDDSIRPETYDQRREREDPGQSQEAPDNPAQIKRIPNHALVYEYVKDDQFRMVALPVEGKGLWSTMYGFLALDKDTNTIRGITYYDQAETPGLGGEVENPRWTALWKGRKAFDQAGQPAIQVIKGAAGSPEQDPHKVDGLSGATITSKGVTYMMKFWLGENGFEPYLEKLRQNRSA
ncbi:MAG: Na(+)-translocating NADH-quinone reductase subunit C [Candidatus Hydrogenedentes bacterium]|nr:Na(+)-translocating NADH-quinone reductase subunit C [Candidatus Hydrogenedentota bacterium]